MPPTQGQVLRTFNKWFSSLKPYERTHGLPARGTIAASLVVLEHLKARYDLNLQSLQAEGKAQIRGLNKAAVQAILSRFGEDRLYAGEGGRTNRGAPGQVELLLDALRGLRLEKESPEDRSKVLDKFQSLLVEKVREWHGRKRLTIAYDPSVTTWAAVHEILTQAAAVSKAGPVAQYLVGAKLQLRFPELAIANAGYSAADVQTGRPGDFQIEDTAFHVTVAPAAAVYE
jgi:hypothetical protein